jgi:hypothetical protein
MNKGIIPALVLMVAIFFLSGYADKEEAGKIENNNTERLNPFLTREEEEIFRRLKGRIPIDYLNLSAIFYSPDNESRVIIDGQILRKGQTIDSKKIVEIQPEVVILKDTQGEYIMRLKRVQGEQ